MGTLSKWALFMAETNMGDPITTYIRPGMILQEPNDYLVKL